MYYQNYEDYMQSILGYKPQCPNIYNTNNCVQYCNNNCLSYQDENQLEELFPEIYKILNPIVIESCDEYSGDINIENIEKIENNIYKKIENNKEIILKINININNRNDDRQIKRIPIFNDLIRILILKNLLGGWNKLPPNKPPFPGPGNGTMPPPPQKPGPIRPKYYNF